MRWALGFVVGGLMASSLLADDQPNDEKTGLEVGTKAPPFKLKDQAGKERTLREFRRKGPVAIVFLRSAFL